MRSTAVEAKEVDSKNNEGMLKVKSATKFHILTATLNPWVWTGLTCDMWRRRRASLWRCRRRKCKVWRWLTGMTKVSWEMRAWVSGKLKIDVRVDLKCRDHEIIFFQTLQTSPTGRLLFYGNVEKAGHRLQTSDICVVFICLVRCTGLDTDSWSCRTITWSSSVESDGDVWLGEAKLTRGSIWQTGALRRSVSLSTTEQLLFKIAVLKTAARNSYSWRCKLLTCWFLHVSVHFLKCQTRNKTVLIEVSCFRGSCTRMSSPYDDDA